MNNKYKRVIFAMAGLACGFYSLHKMQQIYQAKSAAPPTPVKTLPFTESVQPHSAPQQPICALFNDCTPVTTVERDTLPSGIATNGNKTLRLSDHVHRCTLQVDKDARDQVGDMLNQLDAEIGLVTQLHQVNTQLTLSITSARLPAQFADTLTDKIKLLLHVYERSFALTLQQKITINLVILPDNDRYLSTLANLSIDSPASQGLFWTASNYAFVAYKNEQQVMQTALHETVHALNYVLVGAQPRWLNEGLAELFETLQVNESETGVTARFMIEPQTGRPTPLDYVQLIYSEEQWDSAQRPHLYSSARAFLSFLATQRHGIQVLSHLLREERRQPCTHFSDDEYIQLIEDQVFDLQTLYEEWLAN